MALGGVQNQVQDCYGHGAQKELAFQKHQNEVKELVAEAAARGTSWVRLGAQIHRSQRNAIPEMHREGVEIFKSDILPRGKAIIQGWFGRGNSVPRGAYTSYQRV